MPIVTPTNKSVTQLRGLHLYHADISNCSMRVRITLEEKGLKWISHHLDLAKKENVTPEYFGIHPKGLVPTLVHDGVVIVESTDIIEYLDDKYPSPPLRPASTSARAQVKQWLDTATNFHVSAVKTYIYGRKMGTRLRKSEEEAANYRALQRDPELLAFHGKVASATGLTADEISAAEQRLRVSFDKAESALDKHKWLVGEQFTLADIAWAPLHFTLIGAGFPFQEYPHVSAWAVAIGQRPSFKAGVLKWCPKF